MRIVVQTPNPSVVDQVREQAGDALVVAADEAAVLAALPGADALIVANNDYTEKMAQTLNAPESPVRWVQTLTAGFDRVQKWGVPPSVVVTNAGDALAPGVAAHTVALLLALQRRLPAFIAQQTRHAWERGAAAQVSTPSGATCLTLGFGHVGQEVARLLKPFGARIVALTRSGAAHPLADESLTMAHLHDALRRADMIVLALPLDASTHRLMGAGEFALCKRNAVLVNVARGEVVDAAALAQALRDGLIAGAGVDVTDPEPLPADDPLWDAPNLIVTPHVAAACGPLLHQRIGAVAAGNVRRFMDGAPLAHVARF
ncbi:MAG: D-isomer specific 2-hydroxyacid dehydrogenase NAD-binding [Hyphomicrobiales bacterium]|nr:D-isomer specific 2-hydroxyacid dehydrogenase NAD-binding [Hyphomicrobiales bacterium]